MRPVQVRIIDCRSESGLESLATDKTRTSDLKLPTQRFAETWSSYLFEAQIFLQNYAPIQFRGNSPLIFEVADFSHAVTTRTNLKQLIGEMFARTSIIA